MLVAKYVDLAGYSSYSPLLAYLAWPKYKRELLGREGSPGWERKDGWDILLFILMSPHYSV